MRIMSRKAVHELVVKEESKHNCILIHEPDCYALIEPIVPKCKNVLCLGFGDYVGETRPGAPTKEDVRQALEWMVPDVVSCQMGSSRSSAIAFLVQCKLFGPEEAYKLWDVNLHYPNELVLKHGVEFLGKDIIPYIKMFYGQVAQNKKWKYDLVTKYFR